MNYGEIWYVDFGKKPELGHEYGKIRPAVIIESNEKIKICDLITVIVFTSNINNRIKDDIVVKKAKKIIYSQIQY